MAANAPPPTEINVFLSPCANIKITKNGRINMIIPTDVEIMTEVLLFYYFCF